MTSDKNARETSIFFVWSIIDSISRGCSGHSHSIICNTLQKAKMLSTDTVSRFSKLHKHDFQLICYSKSQE